MGINNKHTKKIEEQVKAVYDICISRCPRCEGFKVQIEETESFNRDITGLEDTIDFCTPIMTPYFSIFQEILSKIKKYHIDDNFVVRIHSWIHIANEAEE